MAELSPDQKGKASITFKDVILQTADYYPDPRFRPRSLGESTTYHVSLGIDTFGYPVWITADGIGTKPEFVERLYDESIKLGIPTPELAEGLAYAVFNMIDGDVARDGGHYLVGVANILDENTAEDSALIHSLALGMQKACKAGQFALLNGETAELGPRVGGFGDTKINWNAVGLFLIAPEKEFKPQDLQSGQPVVAFRETTIRSNGLTMARRILEAGYFWKQGLADKAAYIKQRAEEKGVIFDENLLKLLPELFGPDTFDRIFVPWHQLHGDIARKIILPSPMYGPIMYEAQGKIDEPRKVNMVAAAHITGGGIPEKGMRMVKPKRYGLELSLPFEAPVGVKELIQLAEDLPDVVQHRIGYHKRTPFEQWNMGIGFFVVTKNEEEARRLIGIAGSVGDGCDAKIAGYVTDKPEIRIGKYTWTY